MKTTLVGNVATHARMQLRKATAASRRPAALIINADDWGRDCETTDRICECMRRGAVSSTSAMVFMADSKRAADLALENGFDAGLHLNLTTEFSSAATPAGLAVHQDRLRRYLRSNPIAKMVFHPGLAKSFRYVVSAQLEEFERLYKFPPGRIDGHHHMHLCANVLLGRLLPEGVIARRSFSFLPGDRRGLRVPYRSAIDRLLAKRHRIVDLFFSIAPLRPAERLHQIADLSRRFLVELETHPVISAEYHFLLAVGTEADATGMAPVHGFTRPDAIPVPKHRRLAAHW